jgi:hypothetical protein
VHEPVTVMNRNKDVSFDMSGFLVFILGPCHLDYEMWCQFICCISIYGVVQVLWSNLRRLLREFGAENVKQQLPDLPLIQNSSISSSYY